jgi:hypothetical protein
MKVDWVLKLDIVSKREMAGISLKSCGNARFEA